MNLYYYAAALLLIASAVVILRIQSRDEAIETATSGDVYVPFRFISRGTGRTLYLKAESGATFWFNPTISPLANAKTPADFPFDRLSDKYGHTFQLRPLKDGRVVLLGSSDAKGMRRSRTDRLAYAIGKTLGISERIPSTYEEAKINAVEFKFGYSSMLVVNASACFSSTAASARKAEFTVCKASARNMYEKLWRHLDECKKSNGWWQRDQPERVQCSDDAAMQELGSIAVFDFLMFNYDRFKPELRWKGFSNNLFGLGKRLRLLYIDNAEHVEEDSEAWNAEIQKIQQMAGSASASACAPALVKLPHYLTAPPMQAVDGTMAGGFGGMQHTHARARGGDSGGGKCQLLAPMRRALRRLGPDGAAFAKAVAARLGAGAAAELTTHAPALLKDDGSLAKRFECLLEVIPPSCIHG